MASWLDGPGEPIPGAGPTDRRGPVIAVPVPATATDQVLMSGDCYLCGWSFRESTGLAGAVAELFDGGGSGGVLLGCIDVMAGADPSATQTPAAQTLTGANAQQAPQIGGAAGTLAFVTGIEIRGLGATGASVVDAVLSGVLGGSIHYAVTVPAGATVAIAPVSDSFAGRGLAASGLAVPIVLTLPAFGAGNTQEQATVIGYVQGQGGAADTQWFGGEGIYVRGGLALHPVVGSVRGTVWVRL